MGKTVPEVLRKTEARGRGPYIDRGHSFSQYRPLGRQITFLFLFIYLTETFVGFVCHEFAFICLRARW